MKQYYLDSLRLHWILYSLCIILLLFGYCDCYRPSIKRSSTLFSHNNEITFQNKYIESRATILKQLTLVLLPFIPLKSYGDNRDIEISIPLEKRDGVYLLNFSVGENTYRAIVDTGSPFVLAPSICSGLWGCEKEKGKYVETGLEQTIEIFGGQEYDVDWIKANIGLGDDKNRIELRNIIFGVVGEDIFNPPGGLFFGLIKYKQDRIRPTFLQQTNFKSFKFDTKLKTLVLSSKNLIDSNIKDTIKIVDLRPFGCPVYQYAALVKKLIINNVVVNRFKGPIYAIFDTGTTGCLISDAIKNDITIPSLIREVGVVLESIQGTEILLTAKATRDNIFVVSGKNIPWFKNNLSKYVGDVMSDILTLTDEYHKPQIVVLGISFFENKVFTVDIENGNMLLQ